VVPPNQRPHPPAPSRKGRGRLWGFVLALLTGCTTGPDYQRPPLEIPAAYRVTPETAAAAWPSRDWWRGFHSDELNALIEQAKAQNFDIAAAIARVRQEDAQVRIAGASLLPTLNGTAGASWEHVGFGTGSNAGGSRFVGGTASEDLRSYNVGLSAAYQLDFWGRNQALRLAAVNAAMFSRFDQQTVALTVVTNVANTWFTCLALVDRLDVAQRNLAAAEQTLAVIRGRLEAGTASALDIAQQESLVNAERAIVPGLRNQLEQALISLGILVGRPPEAITARPGSLTELALPLVSAGLPSALLQRRPDVASAEAQLIAQHLDINAARAAFFPTVQLTGSAGYEAPALAALISPAGALTSLAAGLTAPIFDGGTLRGQLEQARGRYDELLADYRKAVVQAFTDVDQALAAWRFTTEQEFLQRIAVETARRAATIANAQMLAGTVDITTVLTTETTLFNDEDTLAQVRLARIQALLNLYKALGGGWAQPDGPPQDQFPGLSPGRLRGGVVLPIETVP
jgi:NodT family efflux transporter outer membrane factor (OMF) lipoprotein